VGNENIQNQSISITIKDSDDKIVKELSDEGSYGFNTFSWNLRLENSKDDKSGTYLSPGTYTVTYKINESTDETTFEVTSNSTGNGPQRMFSSPEEIEFEEH
jgi:hypothetical protein